MPIATAEFTEIRYWRFFELLRTLIIRDIKVMYKGSVLGIAWSMIIPIVQLLIFYFLFQRVFSLKIPRYSLFAFSGILAWSWFQASLFQGTGVIMGSRELLRQPRFPVAILPVAAVGTNLINFLISMVVLLLFLLLNGTFPNISIAAFPLVMAVQILLMLSLVYFLAAFNVLFRDTQHILAVLLQLYFFLTPIFYDISSVPEQYRIFYNLNPMAHLVSAYRNILMHGLWPQWLPLAVIAALSSGFMYVTFRFFKKTSYQFAEEL